MSEEQAVVVAESAPAALPELSELTPVERQEWRKTGEMPKKAESAPAKEPAPDSGPDKAAASDSATEKGKPHKKTPEDTEKRFKELLDERADLRRRLEALEKGEKKADPPPVKAEEPKHPGKRGAWMDSWLKGNQGKTYEDALDAYDEVVAKFNESGHSRRIQDAIAADRQQQSAAQRNKEMFDRIAEIQKTDPEFTPAKLEEAAGKVMAADVPQIVKLAIGRSDQFTDLMRVLSGEKIDEFVAIAKADPLKAVKQIGKIEDEIAAELSKGGKKEQARENGKFVKESTEEKKATSETKPLREPIEVGGRQSASEDAGEHAVKNGDFRSAKAKWDAEYIAAHR